MPVYVLKNEAGHIIGFSEDVTTGSPDATSIQIVDSDLSTFAGRFRLQSDKGILLGDDTDTATITLTSNTDVASIDIRYVIRNNEGVPLSDTVESIALTDGTGTDTLSVLSNENISVLVEPADKSAFWGSIVVLVTGV